MISAMIYKERDQMSLHTLRCNVSLALNPINRELNRQQWIYQDYNWELFDMMSYLREDCTS